jgi:hypothetical protein
LDFPGRDNGEQSSFSSDHGVSSAFASGEHESSVCDPGNFFPQDGVPESHVSFSSAIPDKVSPSLADARQMIVQFATHLMNVSPNKDGETPRDLVHGPPQPASQFGSSSSPPPKAKHIVAKTLSFSNSHSVGQSSGQVARELVPSSDAEFEVLLATQRVADAATSSSTEVPVLKRKREVLSDHAYKLRKERTNHLFASIRDCLISSPPLRRSPRLRPPPVESDPQSSVVDRPADEDNDDPDASMMAVTTNFATFGINKAKQFQSSTRVILTVRQIRRVMAAKESLF